jgi:hypothetical protein
MTHSAPEFAMLTPKELLNRLVLEEDRVPLELIDACAAHGEAMVEVLREAIDDEYTWSDELPDTWWVPLHAAFILGRIPTESGGLLLVHLMRSLDERDAEDLQDWLAGNWPAVFANKPPGAIEAARELAEDRSLDWYIRCQGIDVALDAGLREGAQALDGAIDWAAARIRDESDEWLFRISAACTLLGFPRERIRPLLETMAQEEQRRQAENGYGFVGMFTTDDVDAALARNTDKPDWHRLGDPWKFYDPDAIARRQERWQEEDARAAAYEPDADEFDPNWDATSTYVRATPKTGRNEPCPCGSGKKYKRCCLARDEAAAKISLEQTWH